ncbi:MAG TPA: AGE family epimerase/isomerase [Clostridia bacterium]|nr:AGE family epimerase/isomerase [Clostridia bacterium]
MITKVNALKRDFESEVQDFLGFWEKYVIHFGEDVFYGIVDSNLVAHPNASKHLVLGARLVWTFSSAYRIFKKDSYKELSKRLYDFFVAHFIDKEHGGAFWELKADGTPLDTSKRVYGQSFAIYALSEYYRAFRDAEALDLAVSVYNCLETHAYDKDNKGYFEAFSRDWKMDQVEQVSNINPYASASKTMNTHLHLLEAYTSLYRVWKDDVLEDKLKEHIHVMVERIVNHENWHYMLYFDAGWQSQSPDISYGHDIEGSWLLWEAAEIIGDSELEEFVRPVSLKMAEAVFDNGWHPDGGIIYETDPEKGTVQDFRSWWVQSEALVGFYNAWQLGGEDKYLKATLDVYEFIDEELTDHENGGWYPNAISDNRQGNRADGWICPYHNARMYFELIERV